MAYRDRPSVVSAAKLARVVLARARLSPPIDVFALLQQYAELEFAKIPGTVDGLVYQRPGEKRPRVIVSDRLRRNRQRFTAAHELGHITIPWQIAGASCHTDEVSTSFSAETVSAPPDRYELGEREANAFAGELLAPTDWVRTFVSPGRELARCVMEAAQAADVSPMVAAFAVANVADRAQYYITAGDDTILSLKGVALGRQAKQDWSIERMRQYVAEGGVYSTEAFGGYTLHCVQFPAATLRKKPVRASAQLLDSIIVGITKAEHEQAALRRKVNGVVGSANTETAGRDVIATFEVLKHRFRGRPAPLREFADHALCGEYLLAVAYELVAKRTANPP